MATSRGLTTATSIRQETVEVRSGLGPDTAAGMRTDEAGTNWSFGLSDPRMKLSSIA